MVSPRVGLALFARAPVDGSLVANVLPSMLLLGLGAGLAFNPVLLAAMGDVDQSDSGLASGIVNTSFMMGGAVGLAALASVAASRTDAPAGLGRGPLAALLGGYHLAYLIGAAFALVAAVLSALLLRSDAPRKPDRTTEPAHANRADARRLPGVGNPRSVPGRERPAAQAAGR